MGEAAARTPDQCAECGVTDVDPKHTIAYPGPDGLVPVTRHMECCRASGNCDDGSCNQILQASGEARGQQLIAYLTGASA